MLSKVMRIWGCMAILAMIAVSPSFALGADDAQTMRGKYLVTFGGCNDCHTAGYFFGKPDMDRYLGGSDVAFEMPGLGAFVGRNITPDKDTGIGNWTVEQIVTALRTGERPDGRVLAPIMPYHAFAFLSDDDAMAIARYLKTIKPVKHKVPGPFGPGETVPTFMFRILPPGATAADATK
jgi:mono/diheme cytochrome c family protein